MEKLFIAFIACIFMVFTASAQTFQPKQLNYNDKGIVYNKEFTVDFRLHTNGFALAANIGKIKTYYKTRYYHFEIGELRHYKEYRQSFDYPSFSGGRTSRSFVFGKQNSLYVARVGLGTKRYFSEKARKKGLAVGMSYQFGPSLGIVKPYYLELQRTIDGGTNSFLSTEKYSEENAGLFLDINNIYGSSSFAHGLKELSVLPGGHAKLSIHFDWGAFDEFVKALEAGIMADVYFKKVPLMVSEENRPFFINLFIALQLGKRW